MGKSAEEIARKYGGVAVEETAPNADEIAKKYGGTVESTQPPPAVSHGASGSWGEPMDVAERFQTEHPLLSSPITAVARFGKSAVDTGVGMGSAVYHAATDKRRPDEPNLPMTLMMGKRLLLDPQREEKRKSNEANTSSEAFGHAVAAGTPLVGPMISQLTEQALNQGIPEALGSLAMMYMGGKATEAVLNRVPGTKPVLPPAATEQTISAMSTMIESGVPNDVVNKYAEQTIPIWRQAAAEMGKTEQMFPGRSSGSEASRRALREGVEHAVDIANHAVDITNRPFEDVLRQHGKLSIEPAGAAPNMTVKGKLLADLDGSIAENSNNPPLQKALRDLRQRVEGARTYNDLQSLKVLANKKSSGIFDKSTGAQINASADAAYSWRVLGDAIRANMYPELSRISGTDLSAAGRMEAIVMDARDGIQQHAYKDVLNPHNKRMQQTYWEHVRDGSLAHRAMWKRALFLEPTAAGQFNQRFMGVLGGETPQMPNVVPSKHKGSYNFAPETTVGEPQVINELFPAGAPNEQPLLAPPPGNANAIGQEIFKVQQRANQAERAAPPPTVTGVQSELLPSGGPGMLAAPSTPVTGNPVNDFYVAQRQGQLWRKGEPAPKETGQLSMMRGMTQEAAPESTMGIRQTPVRFNPMERTTYTMQDLQSMLHEIQTFVQNNPNHPQVSELMRDIDSVRNELHRRSEAHETPKEK